MKYKLLIAIQFAISLTGFSQTGLLGSYPFNGNANDVSGNGNNGTISGATLTADRFGNLNSAYLFNGINSYIDLGNNLNYSSHSFSCWARRDSASGNMLVSKINNGPYDLQNSEYSINVFTVGSGTAWNNVNSTASTVDYSQWNCFVATYNASTGMAKLYTNGVADSVVVGIYSDVINTPTYIGARPYWVGSGGPAFFFAGAIDEVNIYNRVLTQHEVDSLCPSITTSIPKLESNELNIFPNPFSSTCLIITDKILKSASLTIYNSYGQQVRNINNIQGQTIQLQRDNLPTGIYFIQLVQDNILITSKKIIITD